MACDISIAAVGRAVENRLVEEISALVADLRRLPYARDTFQAAICVHVMPYFTVGEIRCCLAEFCRVLRPGGRLYTDWLDQDDREYGQGRPVEPGTFADGEGIPVHFSTQEEIQYFLSGFRIKHMQPFSIPSVSGKRTGWVTWAQKT